jgi:Kef-type K+ transport system membrane component KefB
MDNNLLLLAITTYVVIITLGVLLHKYLRMPWMFTVVMYGILLSALGLFKDVFQSANFQFLSKMGMLFFLFTIGVDLEMKKIRQLGKYIIRGGIFLTLIEGFVLGLLFFFVYPEFVNHSFFIAFIAGVAFGTVGEIILLAILKEFGLENTKFGQLALGIGVLDDIFEIAALALIVALSSFQTNGLSASAWVEPLEIIAILVGIFAVTFLLFKIGTIIRESLEKIEIGHFSMPFLILLVIFSFFYFSFLKFEYMSVVAAIFSGIAVQHLLPEKFVSRHKGPIYFVGNIFLGPFFFLSVGHSISFNAILDNAILIISIVLISITVRVVVSYLLFQKILGEKQSAVLGVGLCAKFSTSVVSENLLMTSGLIAAPLYSAIMAAYILMKPIIIGVFSRFVASIKDNVK